MHSWFQNLKKQDNEKRLFHFRGSFGRDWNKTWIEYSAWSGRALRFEFTLKPRKSISLSLGLIFFSIHLKFPFFSFARWTKENRLCGFYFYLWNFSWSLWAKEHESSSNDPWWMHAYIHIDELFLGKGECVKDQIATTEENIYFKMGDKEFKMDTIKWFKRRHFRRFIPYVLFHKTRYSVEMEIKNPPMRSGKGENSWDCEDDGTYGLYGPWEFEVPTWQNRDESIKKAIKYYVGGVLRKAERYGGARGERGINSKSQYEFVGKKKVA